MADLDKNEIREMRTFMSTVTGNEPARQGRTERLREESRPDQAIRVARMAKHLCEHVSALTVEDLEAGLGSMIDAVYASQAIDLLFETRGETETVHASRQLYKYFRELSENEIAEMLGQTRYAGQEFDVLGLVNALGTALDEMDGAPVSLAEVANEPKYFGYLVKDLIKLAHTWGAPTELREAIEDAPLTVDECKKQLEELLQQHGIWVDSDGDE